MDGGGKFLAIGSVIIIAVILQVVLVMAGPKDTPGHAAVEFSKAYFMLDGDMAERLCSEVGENDGSEVVADYLQRMAAAARTEGFAPSWKKMALSHIEIETRMVDDNTAQVHLSCHRRRSPNLIFGAVAKVFFLSDSYPVDATLTVVKEDGRWKVCGRPFSLMGS
jgi:hypothetical protein